MNQDQTDMCIYTYALAHKIESHTYTCAYHDKNLIHSYLIDQHHVYYSGIIPTIGRLDISLANHSISFRDHESRRHHRLRLRLRLRSKCQVDHSKYRIDEKLERFLKVNEEASYRILQELDPTNREGKQKTDRGKDEGQEEYVSLTLPYLTQSSLHVWNIYHKLNILFAK